MIWQPASVKRMPGHVLVGWESVAISSGRLYIRHAYPTIHHAVTVVGLLKDFFLVDPSIYYVNGRKEVYQTNIPINRHVTFFTPVGWQRDDNTPVLFRKLHKLEWLFS